MESRSNLHIDARFSKPLLALLSAFVLAAVDGGPARAQTPTTTVKDASGNTVFQTFAQGQLLAPGPYITLPALS